MARLPFHRHADAGAARGMVVEQHLLERARLELAIFAELHVDHGVGVGLARRLEPERVGLALADPGHGVEHGRKQEDREREDNSEHGRNRGIADIANAPTLAITREQPRRGPPQQEEQADRDQRQIEQRLGDVAEDVMPHLMSHHRHHALGGRAVEEIVVEADADRRAEAGDVGRDALGLFRGVEHIDVVGRDMLGVGHRQDARPHRPFGHWGIFVEQRREKYRRDHHHQREQQHRRAARPQPPAARGAADDREHDGEEDRGGDDPDQQGNALLP